ncbi:unnamed protein product [Symbiodinium natans]|uniref:YHYH domain-containing protein n=1 Tax=Symbiodinium natans TaxID=878477 RepID=A0A812HBR5_9DINO|nr:unnamed protein product [Symbiodinium natans]
MGPIRAWTLAAVAVNKVLSQDCSGHGVTWGQGIGPPPDGCGNGGPPTDGGTTAGCTNPTCASPPCGARLLGDVGCTTVSGTETLSHELISAGGTIAANAHIYGPFEAGFTDQQSNIISNWGCSDPTLVYDTEGGKDIGIAERHVAYKCNIEFPRTVGNTYFGVVGPCGGHTGDYHFHRSFACLYSASGGHSTKVGVVTSYNIYGKWEDYENNKLPLLDACGAHIGPTPESSTPVYHYHVQDQAPFTVGCHGPSATGGLVSLSVCRSLYPDCGSSRDVVSITLKTGTVQYARFCPCFDATGSNVDTQELPALGTSEISYTAGSTTTSSTSTSSASSTTDSSSTSTISPSTDSSSTQGTTPSTSSAAGTGSSSTTPSSDSSTSESSTSESSTTDASTSSASPSYLTSGGFLSNKAGWLLGAAGCLAVAPDAR